MRVAFGAALVALMTVLVAGPAAAEQAPFKDANAKGTIGLCDKNRKPVTSGSLKDQPFVWTAVSSAPTPKGFEKGKAVLYAFQPRENVEPGQWSGRQLTASSTFTNSKHPMAQATNADDPLLFFVQAFPPRWQGLIQLRMYFAAEGRGAWRFTYPATVLRVTGDNWAIVSGGRAECTAGTARSVEVGALPASALASPKPLAVAGSKASSGPQSSSGSDLTSLGTGGTDGGFSGGDVVRFGFLGLAFLGLAGGGLRVWRRRRAIET